MAQFYNKQEGAEFYVQYAYNSVGMNKPMHKRTAQIYEFSCKIAKEQAVGSHFMLKKAK